jgi:alpha-tubulin suppressor-like RCC1 family protein
MASALATTAAPASELRYDPLAVRHLVIGDALPEPLRSAVPDGLRVTAVSELDSGAFITLVHPRTNAVRASLLLREGRVTGAIERGDMTRDWISSPEAGRCSIDRFDVRAEAPCGNHDGMKPPAEAEGEAAGVSCEDGSTIDVLGAYTDRVRQLAGGDLQVIDAVYWNIEFSNAVYANSGIPLRLRLVGCERLTGYSEVSALDDNLMQLADNDGNDLLDPVHALRDRLGADLVALFCQPQETAWCGFGFLPQSATSAAAGTGFSVTDWDCRSSITFAHEVGHNMGCCHERVGAGAPCNGLFAYSNGNYFTGTDNVTYRTIMAYPPGADAPVFSGPAVVWAGTVTGVAGETDNVRTINDTRLALSNYRATTMPDPPTQAWGNNTYNQTRESFVTRTAIDVACGRDFSTALLVDGTVKCWGENGSGQCTVPANLPAALAVTAGESHTVALLENGTVRCWGSNLYGQATVPANLGAVRQVVAGNYHTVVVLATGLVRAWGAGEANTGTNNQYGQATPPPDLGAVTDIGAGWHHTIAVRDGGTVRCWGRNQLGQSSVPAGLGAATRVAAGFAHSVALLADGTVRCWGSNQYGQATVPPSLPVVTRIASGREHVIALLVDGTIRCWGRNQSGQTDVPEGLGSVVRVSAGGSHTLVLTQPNCRADLNSDRAVDGIDLGIIMGAWGTPAAGPDLNADGTVNGLDLGVVLGSWGNCPSPCD